MQQMGRMEPSQTVSGHLSQTGRLKSHHLEALIQI